MPGEYKAVMIDLDGVLYVGNDLLPGAVEAVSYLAENNIQRCFLTNTTTRSLDDLYRKVSSLGLAIKKSQIVSAPQAAVRLVTSFPPEATSLFRRGPMVTNRSAQFIVDAAFQSSRRCSTTMFTPFTTSSQKSQLTWRTANNSPTAFILNFF